MGAMLGASDLRVPAGAAWGAGRHAARRRAGHGRPGWRRSRKPPGEAGTLGNRTSSSWRAPRRPGLGTGGPLEPRGGCGRREDGRSGQGPDRGQGRGGAQKYQGRTGAQRQETKWTDREKMRETQRQTRAGVINLASEQSLPLPKPTVHGRVRPTYPGPGLGGPPLPSAAPPPRCTRGLHPASLPQVAHGELQYLCFLQLRVPEVLQTGGEGAKTEGRGERGKWQGEERREGCRAGGAPGRVCAQTRSALPKAERR